MAEFLPGDLPHVANICAALDVSVKPAPGAYGRISSVYAHAQDWLAANDRPSVPFGAFTRTLRALGLRNANKHVVGIVLISRQHY